MNISDSAMQKYRGSFLKGRNHKVSYQNFSPHSQLWQKEISSQKRNQKSLSKNELEVEATKK